MVAWPKWVFNGIQYSLLQMACLINCIPPSLSPSMSKPNQPKFNPLQTKKQAIQLKSNPKSNPSTTASDQPESPNPYSPACHPARALGRWATARPVARHTKGATKAVHGLGVKVFDPSIPARATRDLLWPPPFLDAQPHPDLV